MAKGSGHAEAEQGCPQHKEQAAHEALIDGGTWKGRKQQQLERGAGAAGEGGAR